MQKKFTKKVVISKKQSPSDLKAEQSYKNYNRKTKKFLKNTKLLKEK